jgi:hypothetical protein
MPIGSHSSNDLHISLTTASEEHPHDKHLQASHADHHSALQQAEVEHPLLRAPDSAEVPVLARAEVFLLAGEGGDLARDLEDRLFHAAELLGGCAGLLGEVGAGLVFDLWVVGLVDGSLLMCMGAREASYRNLKVNKLVCEGRDGVVEAEAVFAGEVGCEDVVALALLLALQDDLLLARLF